MTKDTTYDLSLYATKEDLSSFSPKSIGCVRRDYKGSVIFTNYAQTPEKDYSQSGMSETSETLTLTINSSDPIYYLSYYQTIGGRNSYYGSDITVTVSFSGTDHSYTTSMNNISGTQDYSLSVIELTGQKSVTAYATIKYIPPSDSNRSPYANLYSYVLHVGHNTF